MTHHGVELSHLEQANRHVAENAGRIAQQENLVAELDRDGHDTSEAVKLLNLLRATQEQATVHRAEILKALGEPEDGSAG